MSIYREPTRQLRHDWIEGWSGNDSIGGRAIDVSQIAWSLERSIKAAFPINSVPSDIANKLVVLIATLDHAENAIDSFIADVSNVLAGREYKERIEK